MFFLFSFVCLPSCWKRWTRVSRPNNRLKGNHWPISDTTWAVFHSSPTSRNGPQTKQAEKVHLPSRKSVLLPSPIPYLLPDACLLPQTRDVYESERYSSLRVRSFYGETESTLRFYRLVETPNGSAWLARLGC